MKKQTQQMTIFDTFILKKEPTKVSKVKEKPVDNAHIKRNERMLNEIDDIICQYKMPFNYCSKCNCLHSNFVHNDYMTGKSPMTIERLFSISSADRISCLASFDEITREDINYRIMGLFR
jgi:hypothetical protein